MSSYRKKMIEVALPLEAINKASAKEKSIRHGHPSTLHLWWARRPLAACRAVLFASLVDDPDSDPEFRKPNGKVDEEKAAAKRAALFDLIEDLVKWENSNNPTVINKARAEIARCVASRKIELGELDKATTIFGKDKGKKHKAGPISNEGVTAYEVLLMRARPEVVNAFLAEYAPPVLDPFCGGGSIPLEAQRLGLRAYGSDLNPVPVLITKALIEIPPKFAGKSPVNPASNAKLKGGWTGSQGLAEDVRYYGKWMRDEAEKRIGHLYPKVKITKEMANNRPDLTPHIGQDFTIIAWLWARTVPSLNPACAAAHVPLFRNFWLSTRPGGEAWVEPIVKSDKKSYSLVVRRGQPPASFDADRGTVDRKGGLCLLTGVPMPFSHIRAEACAGRMKERLVAMVIDTGRERLYLSPIPEHERAVLKAHPSWRPDGEMPKKHRNFQPPVYGMNTFGDLFTSRQLSALGTLAELVEAARQQVVTDSKGSLGMDYADAIATYLAFCVDKNTLTNCTQATWQNNPDRLTQAFSRQALAMTWNYAEANPLSDAGGGFGLTPGSVAEVLERLPENAPIGLVEQRDAAAPTPLVPSALACTDPPYYDNIAYAELSDFFYGWMRKAIGHVYRSLFATVQTPKTQELVAAPYRHGGSKEEAKSFFEAGLVTVFSRMYQFHVHDCPLPIYYAFKQTETESGDDDEQAEMGTASTGWETMLEGLIRAGFSITGTWPVRTELVANLKKNISALASSVLLTCRQRSDSALATRREFLNALKRELPESLRNLQRGSIAPVDLAQAAIGPGMAVFTRYAKVMETDGSAMSVRTALGLINQALDEVLAEQEGEFDGDTRWALAWFEQFGMEEGQFGVAETLSKAKNTAVNGLVEAGVIKARAGKVRLLKRDELPADWNPATDKRLTIWEITQHLIRTLDQKGESGAAALLRTLGGTAEIARDLAYRLYTLCERKRWADEALAYNGLVIAWPELTKLAMSAPAGRAERQADLFT
jgi:putative DNA methylase